MRTNRTGPVPLSFAQRRLWFVEQLQSETALFKISWILRLSGDFDIRCARRTFREIVRRHEVLRTTFPAVDGEPRQEVSEPGAVPVPVGGRERGGGTRRRTRAEGSRKGGGREFDLSGGPVVRVMVVRKGEREHVLVGGMHHIVSDGWSMGIVVRELGALYEGYREGRESGLEELGVQYADYAVWQRKWMSGERLAEEVKYWKEKLEGMERVEVPSDYRRERGKKRGEGEVSRCGWGRS